MTSEPDFRELKTISFRRVDEFELDFDEWYSHNKDEFNTKADALTQWSAMCDNTTNHLIEDEGEFGWDQVEDLVGEIQQEYQTTHYDDEMTKTIDEVFKTFELMGVKCYKDHSCCDTCGHSEAREENYVFYNGQANDDLRKGERSVRLAFSFDDEMKKKVLEMIEEQTCDAIRLHWTGEDNTKIFLTCDDDLMAEHIAEDDKRQARVAKMKVEMKAKSIPTLDELIEFIKREGKDSPLVKEMNAKLQAAVEKMNDE